MKVLQLISAEEQMMPSEHPSIGAIIKTINKNLKHA